MTAQFYDRLEVGRLLANQLGAYANRPDVVVIGLPRGGVVVAYEIAQALQAPLDICLVRKLGAPGYQELAMGAIATGGIMILNHEVIHSLRISQEAIDRIASAEQQELIRRDRLYRGDRPSSDWRNCIAILVDDGIATGSTLRAAIASLRQHQPNQIIVAAPIASPMICQELSTEVDEIVCLLTPDPLFSISLWYQHFPQVTDAEVCHLLAQVPNQPVSV